MEPTYPIAHTTNEYGPCHWESNSRWHGPYYVDNIFVRHPIAKNMFQITELRNTLTLWRPWIEGQVSIVLGRIVAFSLLGWSPIVACIIGGFSLSPDCATWRWNSSDDVYSFNGPTESYIMHTRTLTKFSIWRCYYFYGYYRSSEFLVVFDVIFCIDATRVATLAAHPGCKFVKAVLGLSTGVTTE